jgi:hypothetical protein
MLLVVCAYINNAIELPALKLYLKSLIPLIHPEHCFNLIIDDVCNPKKIHAIDEFCKDILKNKNVNIFFASSQLSPTFYIKRFLSQNIAKYFLFSDCMYPFRVQKTSEEIHTVLAQNEVDYFLLLSSKNSQTINYHQEMSMSVNNKIFNLKKYYYELINYSLEYTFHLNVLNFLIIMNAKNHHDCFS